MTDLDYEYFWNETFLQLKKDLKDEIFNVWFSDMKYLRGENNNIVVGVPTAFHRDKVNSYYLNTILTKLKEISKNETSLELEIIRKDAEKVETSTPRQERKEPAAEKAPKNREKREKHSQLRDDFTFDRYIKGENNSFAVNAAHAISRNPGRVYNPLLIWGGVGLGKTHLMQAIGNFIHENSDNRVIFITSENFLNEYLDAINQDKMPLFKNKYRRTDVLLLDDIQFFTAKPGVQEEFFHTFNALIDAKKQLVFTCDRPIEELKKFDERLISRFSQAIKPDLQPPRYEERCAILKSTAQARGVIIPDEVIDIMGKNISTNVRDLISALNNLIAYTELTGKPITIETTQNHLKNILNTPRMENLTMYNIIRVTADYFGLTPNDLKGKKRSKNIVYARQLAMYIGRDLMDYSTTMLGQEFGGRDHTTVMHSIEKIKKNFLTDPALETTIESLKRSIKEFSAKY